MLEKNGEKFHRTAVNTHSTWSQPLDIQDIEVLLLLLLLLLLHNSIYCLVYLTIPYQYLDTSGRFKKPGNSN